MTAGETTSPSGAPAWFTVRGLRNGSSVHVTWSDGKVSGDPPTVDLVEMGQQMAETSRTDPLSRSLYAGVLAGIDGNPLQYPATAFALIAREIDTVQEITGTLPPGALPTQAGR